MTVPCHIMFSHFEKDGTFPRQTAEPEKAGAADGLDPRRAGAQRAQLHCSAQALFVMMDPGCFSSKGWLDCADKTS